MNKRRLTSGRPVGLVLNVYKNGVGMPESAYGPIFADELAEDGLSYQQDATMPDFKKGRKKPNYCVDLLIDGKMIVELKGGPPEI